MISMGKHSIVVEDSRITNIVDVNFFYLEAAVCSPRVACSIEYINDVFDDGETQRITDILGEATSKISDILEAKVNPNECEKAR